MIKLISPNSVPNFKIHLLICLNSSIEIKIQQNLRDRPES